MLTVAALKKLLDGIPEEVETPYGKIPTWVMLQNGESYTHCHITPGGSPTIPGSIALVVPDEQTDQRDFQFERFSTKGEDDENSNESKLRSRNGGV